MCFFVGVRGWVFGEEWGEHVGLVCVAFGGERRQSLLAHCLVVRERGGGREENVVTIFKKG